MLAKRDTSRLRELGDELLSLRIDRPRLPAGVLEGIRELAEIDLVAMYSVRNRTGRWLVERFESTAELAPAERLMRRMYERTKESPLYYDPAATPGAQRNRVVDALTWIEEHAPGTWEQNTTNLEVCEPLGMSTYRQPRALLCDGPALLAWFGALTPQEPTTRQLRILNALVAPMRRRLIARRQLDDAPYLQATLDLMLDGIGGPAFVIDGRGGIHEHNRAGRVLLDERGSDVRAALVAAVAGQAHELAFNMIALCDDAATPRQIAVLKQSSVETRVNACLDVCARRWRLTARQSQVLALVVRGLPNSTISATLACVERTVELHVSALLDRAGVESRSALVACVLTSVP